MSLAPHAELSPWFPRGQPCRRAQAPRLRAAARALTKKDKPLWVIDTHAGAGCYSLEQRLRGQERRVRDGHRAGCGPAAIFPAPLADYVAQVRAVNPDGVLRIYPGSPQIALQMTRDQDRLRLFERHTNESKALQEAFRDAGRRVAVVAGDGFAGLKAVLPPPSRRGLALIDPSYENASDYAAVLDGDARRAAALRHRHLCRLVSAGAASRIGGPARPSCAASPPGDWLDVSLDVKAPAADGFGLVRQRHVRLQSSVESGNAPARGDAEPRSSAGPRRARGVRPRIPADLNGASG